MKRLFLVSTFKEVSNLLPNFEKNLSGKTVTFIPTAQMSEKIIPQEDEGRKSLEEMGLNIDVLELSSATDKEINDKLKRNDYIYVTGGNTFYLLQEMQRTGADNIIREEVNAGKLYIGESAGAIVTAPNIEYIKGWNSLKKAPLLKNFDALELVSFYMVPHYTNTPFAQKIVDRFADTIHLMPINNQQGILVEGDQVTVLTNQ